MGYYQGDYRRGDFYRGTAGDPFLGGLFSKVFSVGKSLLGLGGGGASTSAIEKAVSSGISKVSSFPGVGAMKQIGGKAIGIVKQHPVITGAGAAGIIGAVGGAVGTTIMHPALKGRGFHISRKTGKMVKNRHMNPCNPRALRRAIRRAHSFERLAKHVIGFSSPRKPHGHMYFKRKRKK
jgi:hypothetical protein